jgi:hypothetical protein
MSKRNRMAADLNEGQARAATGALAQISAAQSQKHAIELAGGKHSLEWHDAHKAMHEHLARLQAIDPITHQAALLGVDMAQRQHDAKLRAANNPRAGKAQVLSEAAAQTKEGRRAVGRVIKSRTKAARPPRKPKDPEAGSE